MPETKAKKTALTPQQLLSNPTRLVVSVSQAAVCLGIAKSTAHNAYRDTGFLTTGVPVLRIGKRCVVATAHLRAVLGLDDPHPVLSFSPVDEMTPDTQLSLWRTWQSLVSSEAIKGWQLVTPERIEQARLSIDERHRPCAEAIELVGLILAVHTVSKRGYVDLTHEQIAARLHGNVSPAGIDSSLRALTNGGIYKTLKRGTKGHGTQRVLITVDQETTDSLAVSEHSQPTDSLAVSNEQSRCAEQAVSLWPEHSTHKDLHKAAGSAPAESLPAASHKEKDESATVPCVDTDSLASDSTRPVRYPGSATPERVLKLRLAVGSQLENGKGKRLSSKEQEALTKKIERLSRETLYEHLPTAPLGEMATMLVHNLTGTDCPLDILDALTTTNEASKDNK